MLSKFILTTISILGAHFDVHAQTPTINSCIGNSIEKIHANISSYENRYPQLSTFSNTKVRRSDTCYSICYERGVIGPQRPFKSIPLSADGAVIYVYANYPYKSDYPEQRMPELEITFSDDSKLLVQAHVESGDRQTESQFLATTWKIITEELRSLSIECRQFGVKDIKFGVSRLTIPSTTPPSAARTQ